MTMRADEGLKRSACLIASQLPEDYAEALRVLEYAKGIVMHLAATKAAGDAASQPSTLQPRHLAIVRADGREARSDYQDRANPA